MTVIFVATCKKCGRKHEITGAHKSATEYTIRAPGLDVNDWMRCDCFNPISLKSRINAWHKRERATLEADPA